MMMTHWFQYMLPQHFALKDAGLCGVAEVVGAFDINTVANEVYSHNFPAVDVHPQLIESVRCVHSP